MVQFPGGQEIFLFSRTPSPPVGFPSTFHTLCTDHSFHGGKAAGTCSRSHIST